MTLEKIGRKDEYSDTLVGIHFQIKQLLRKMRQKEHNNGKNIVTSFFFFFFKYAAQWR